MKNAICGFAPDWLIKGFLEYDVNLTSVGRIDALSAPVSHHIDMMALPFPDGTTILTPESEHLSPYFNKIIITKSHLQPGYPSEALLNAFIFKDTIICNTKTIAPEVLTHAESLGMSIFHVNQGYTNCSISNVCNKAFMTDDRGIFESLLPIEEIPYCNLIKKGSVSLPGYPDGFIGGATACIDNAFFFFGKVEDFDLLYYPVFLGFTPFQLSKTEKLLDIGGVIFLD